ncbi:MAG: endonuclease domain-containing protein [Caldilineaceae bacterium]|nr:endonuclease domain-containing protein [Caldilineaceae bacterium]
MGTDLFPSSGGVAGVACRGGCGVEEVVKQATPAGVVLMRNTKKYKSLPYNPALRDRAKALRKAGILHEALLWLQLKSNKLNGLDFDRQKIIGNYIVDFYCAEKDVVIEVDGSSHDSKQLEDAERDQYLNHLGLTVIRLSAKDVLQNMEGIVGYLRDHPALAGTPPEEGWQAQPDGVVT